MRMATLRRTARVGQVGAVPIEFALGVGVLVLPVALLVLSLPPWVERQSAARLAAREAARAVVLADTFAEGVAAGETAAARVAVNHDIDPGDFNVAVTGNLVRGGAVTATVSARFPATAVPGLTEVASFIWTTAHTEQVDAYRSLP